MERVQVAIVGCGPVGLTLANLLGSHGVSTLVLERNASTVDEPRAISIDAEALRTIQAAGLYESIAKDLVLGFDVEYLNANQRVLFEVPATQTPYGHPLASSFHQPLLEAQLLRGIDRFPHVEVRFGHDVKSFVQSEQGVGLEGVDAGGVAFDAEALFLVGCDGGRSMVREQLGIEMNGDSAPQRWLVIDTNDLALMDELPCRFFCDPRRPAMTLHRTGPGRRWEWMLLPDESEEHMLEDRTIRHLLAPHTRADRVEILRKCVYQFSSIVSDRYRDRRVLLAGDAAHMMPPFAGQGMNSGIRDAANLAWKLARVVGGSSDANLLDSYELERRPHVIEAIRVANRLGGIIQPTQRARAWLRDLAFRAIGATRAGRERFLSSMLDGLRVPALREGVLASSAGDGLVGRMLPQPEVVDSSGSARPLDEHLGTGFAVIGYDDDPTTLPTSELGRLEARRLQVLNPNRAASGGSVVDSSGTLGEFLSDSPEHFVLVRPDRFVAASFRAKDAKQTLSAIDRALCATEPEA